MIVSSIRSICMCSTVVTFFPHCLSSTRFISSTDSPFYFILIFLSLSIAAPCPSRSVQTSWIDPLNWSLVVPLCATVNAEESTLGFKSSPQGFYTAFILLCMYPCKVLCMPVMCSTATAHSSGEPIHRRENMYKIVELKTFLGWNTTVFILQQDRHAQSIH